MLVGFQIRPNFLYSEFISWSYAVNIILIIARKNLDACILGFNHFHVIFLFYTGYGNMFHYQHFVYCILSEESLY